jgi:hypothetical protein
MGRSWSMRRLVPSSTWIISFGVIPPASEAASRAPAESPT